MLDALVSHGASEHALENAVRERSRRSWLRRQAEQETTWEEALAAALRPGASATLGMECGAVRAGEVRLRMDGWVGISETGTHWRDRALGAGTTLMRLSHVAWLRPAGRAPAPFGPEEGAGCLLDALEEASEDRPAISLCYGWASSPLRGRLTAVTTGVIAVDSAEGLLYVWLGSVREISVLDSG